MSRRNTWNADRPYLRMIPKLTGNDPGATRTHYLKIRKDGGNERSTRIYASSTPDLQRSTRIDANAFAQLRAKSATNIVDHANARRNTPTVDRNLDHFSGSLVLYRTASGWLIGGCE